MRTIEKGVSFLLLSLMPGCGQQLVEFGGGKDAAAPVEMSVELDLSVPRDLWSAPDLSASPDMSASLDLWASHDLALSVDLPPLPDMPDMPDLWSPLDLMADAMVDAARPPGPLAPCAAMLGAAAQTFAVLGGPTVTNTGANTQIAGNIGVSPGNAVVGIPNGQPTGGSIHAADALAMQAQMDTTNVFTCSQAAVCDKNLTGTDLGGLTLAQGVYCFSSAAALTGALVLDAKGDPNAIWFIQIMSTLDLADNAHVTIINGGSPCNVFWQVGSSATLGTNAVLVGNMLALASITMKTGASVTGRALARNGATTLDTNVIAKCK